MNIKRAKNEIKNALRAYLAADEFGAYRIPPSGVCAHPFGVLSQCLVLQV